MSRMARSFLIMAVFFAVLPDLVFGQSALPDPGALASQNLRGYSHMFIAYFIAWVMVLGWVVSIARRLARMEKALTE